MESLGISKGRRVTVILPQQQFDFIIERMKFTGKTMSEIIRDAITLYMDVNRMYIIQSGDEYKVVTPRGETVLRPKNKKP